MLLHMKDRRGRTGIMLAAANGHLDMVTLLVGQGADINAADKVILISCFCNVNIIFVCFDMYFVLHLPMHCTARVLILFTLLHSYD